MQRIVWRRSPDARNDLQAGDLAHAHDEGQRSRLPRSRTVPPTGPQLQPGHVRKMARLRVGQGTFDFFSQSFVVIQQTD